MSGTLKIGGKTLATHDTNSNKLAFHSDANDTGQLCRAWVNFNGTLDENSGGLTAGENVLIRASYNVSSVYYNGTGDYTVTFSSAMPDANYSLCGTAQRGSTGSSDVFLSPKQSATYGDAFSETFVRVMARVDNAQSIDSPSVSVAIFR